MATRDRLSILPESLLCSNILSRLPLIEAVRSSILASKWRYLWTKLPKLEFSPDFFRQMLLCAGRCPLLGYSIRPSEDKMEHILIQHDAPLDSFGLRLPQTARSTTIDIYQCLHYAAQKGVKQMSLVFYNTRLMRMPLPFTFFSCTTLVEIELIGFAIPEIPTSSEDFSFLRALCLCDIGNLTDQKLQRLVELCPLLYELLLIKCEEMTHMKIQASNLNYLLLVGCSRVESLIADCPQLLQLKMRNCSMLAELQIHSYHLVDLKLMDCKTLSILRLNSCVFLKRVGSLEGQSIQGHGNVEALRKFSLTRCSSARSDLFRSTLFGIFTDLEELRVTPYMMEQTAPQTEMGASDFIFPTLKNAYLGILPEMSEKEVVLLGLLLRNAPLLKTLRLALPYPLPYCSAYVDVEEFKNQILGLKGASAEVEIIWKFGDQEDEEECYEGRDRWWHSEYAKSNPEKGLEIESGNYFDSPGWEDYNSDTGLWED